MALNAIVASQYQVGQMNSAHALKQIDRAPLERIGVAEDYPEILHWD